jgi:hypothetical protein
MQADLFLVLQIDLEICTYYGLYGVQQKERILELHAFLDITFVERLAHVFTHAF